MTAARVEAHEDHLVIRLDTMRTLGALRHTVVVPYSTIQAAEVGEPEWPGVFDNVRVGTFMPRVLALGTFREWRGRRRFLDLEPRTDRALKLRLDGHPDYDEVEVDARDAEDAIAEVGRRKAHVMQRPPVME